MEQLSSGFWVPCGTNGHKTFFGSFTSKGLPEHCFLHIQACLRAMRKRNKLVAVDGGAYVGMWSMHLVQHFEQVLAFEPIAANVACAIKNMERIKYPERHSWQIESVALSDDARVAEMQTTEKRYASRFDLPDELTNSNTRVAVQTRSLDSYNLHALDLLKLDVEGHEHKAIQGALESIQKFRPVVIIEEKLDVKKRATHRLEKLGMRCVWQKKHDYLFTW